MLLRGSVAERVLNASVPPVYSIGSKSALRQASAADRPSVRPSSPNFSRSGDPMIRLKSIQNIGDSCGLESEFAQSTCINGEESKAFLVINPLPLVETTPQLVNEGAEAAQVFLTLGVEI